MKVSGVKLQMLHLLTSNMMKGEVGGVFNRQLIYLSGKAVNFNLKWNSKQTADGADAITLTDLNGITFTLSMLQRRLPVTPVKPNKPAKQQSC